MGLSGKDGAVLVGATALAEITQWSATKSSDIDNYASSSSAGYQVNVEGTKRMSGSITMKLNTSTPQIGISPVIVEGTSYTLNLKIDATRIYVVPARLSDISLDVVVDGGPAVVLTANFQSNGAWTEPTI